MADKTNDNAQNIQESIDLLNTSLQGLAKEVTEIGTMLQDARAKSTDCREVSETIGARTLALGADVCSFGKDLDTQLPLVLGLIDDVRQIKNNTEAAVTGSARNISLCDEAALALSHSLQPMAKAS